MAADERIKFIADHYGFRSRVGQTMEEAAELIQALNKYVRALGEGQPEALSVQAAEEHIIEEIADVQVCISQVLYLLNVPEEKVSRMREEKLKRTINIINKLEKESVRTAIETMEFSMRTYWALKRAGISTVEELTSMTERDLQKVRGLGQMSLGEIIKKLEKNGESLKEE